MKSRMIKYVSLLVVFSAILFFSIDSIHFGTPPKKETNEIDPAEYAEEFWQKVPDVINNAVDAAIFRKLLETDLDEAIKLYGKTLGVSSVHSFLVRGNGRALEKTDKILLVSTNSPHNKGEILIRISGLFGEFAVRDAFGLVNVSKFKSIMLFNEVGAAINRKIILDVIPSIKENVSEGDFISFVGAVTIDEENPEFNPIKLIPISVNTDKVQD